MSGDDTLDGGSGNDTIIGFGGYDEISAGSGNDTVFGGPRDDVIDGGGGNDVLWGNFGGDDIFGGSGNDFIDGDNPFPTPPGPVPPEFADGPDTCSGGSGVNTILNCETIRP